MRLLTKQTNIDGSITLAYKIDGEVIVFTGVSPFVKYVIRCKKDNLVSILRKINKEGLKHGGTKKNSKM